MANPSVLTKTSGQASQTSPGRSQTLSRESILDSLKLILAGAELSDVLTTVARLIEAQSPGTLCSIFLLEEDGLHLRYAAAPNLPEAYRAATDGMVIGPNIGSCGRAAFLRQPVFASDILSDPNWADFRDAAASAGLRAAWSSPIMSHDSRVLGTFGMYYREVRYPEPSDIELIQYASSITEWADKLKQAAYSRRLEPRKKWGKPVAMRGKKKKSCPRWQFTGQREGPIRETLALASLTVGAMDGNADFKGLDPALNSLRPVVTGCRKDERYFFLYARLICLKNEHDAVAARMELQALLNEVSEIKCGQELPDAVVRAGPRVTSPYSSRVFQTLTDFGKWHATTVARHPTRNTFRRKLERRVRFARAAMSASVQQMGDCSSSGKDTHTREKGSTPLQSRQYRYRSYFRRLRRRYRRILDRKFHPKESRRKRRSQKTSVPVERISSGI